ncbi:MAG: Uma2 family endonuclease, partial [Gloeocapsa sp. DLM2.Bin57]
MIFQIDNNKQTEITYPDSDGQPMADNTLQFRWLTTIKENLEWLFADNNQVFVAGDLLWYPVEGDNKIRQAPDIMVVFGRPKGDRGSYQQWLEDNIPPQVVFEILSPGNRQGEMNRKLLFYQKYGVEEYYLYDPQHQDLSGLIRVEEELVPIEEMLGWVSPRLQIRFEMDTQLRLYHPNGELFSTYTEVKQRA